MLTTSSLLVAQHRGNQAAIVQMMAGLNFPVAARATRDAETAIERCLELGFCDGRALHRSTGSSTALGSWPTLEPQPLECPRSLSKMSFTVGIDFQGGSGGL